VNIEALTHLTHALLPAMLEAGRGAIINVSSLASILPIPNFAVYAATKAYVSSFSEALRMELRGTGIPVLAVCPGPVRTEFEEQAGNDKRGNPGIEPDLVNDQRTELEGVEGIGQLRALGVGAEDHQAGGDEHDRDRGHEQELHMVRKMGDAVDDVVLEQVAEAEKHGCGNGNADQRIKAQGSEKDQGEEHADHHHLAMGEIDDADHPEDDRQAERAEAVDKAGQQTAHSDVEIDLGRQG
jgi:hypothetical protein